MNATPSHTIRAARWYRVSSLRQAESDREGLPYQADLCDAAVTALGASQTDHSWTLAHSGKNVHLSEAWQQMIASAGRDWDILIVAYTSRLARNAEELLRAVRLIGEAGASVYFAEEQTNTADEAAWEATAREAVEAESYRRRLSRTMKRTYASRVRRKGLPAGPSAYGFNPDMTHNPAEAPTVAAIFTEYGHGDVSLRTLAQRHGLAEEQVKVLVRNPAYQGIAQHNGEHFPGSFAPIVSPDLWAQVEQIRRSRRWSGGPISPRATFLRGRLYCGCGAHVRLDGTDGQGKHRVRHLNPCHIWGDAERRRTSLYEEPIIKALSQIRLTDETIERMIAETPAMPAPRVSPRFTRDRERIAQDLVARRITGPQAQYLLDEVDDSEHLWLDDQHRHAQATISTEVNRACLRDFAGMLRTASNGRWGNEVWNNVVSRYISRIEHLGPNTIGLTASTEGLAALVPSTMPRRIEVGHVGGEGSVQPWPIRTVDLPWPSIDAGWLAPQVVPA